MTRFFRKIPLASASLILALFSLSNLVYTNALLSQGIGILGTFFLVLLLTRLLLDFQASLEELKNPVVASTFASFFMSLFLFSSKLPLDLPLKKTIWLGLLALYGTYIVLFSRRFLSQKKLGLIFPSWFVVYIGPAISVVTLPSPDFNWLGLVILVLTGTACLALLPFVSYRLITNKLTQAQAPLFAILAAPLALLLTAYLKWTQAPHTLFTVALLSLSQGLLLFALLVFVKQVKQQGFTPLFAAFSFPLVSSTTALRLSSLAFENPWLTNLLAVETVLSLLIIAYISVQFLLLIGRNLPLPVATEKTSLD